MCRLCKRYLCTTIAAQLDGLDVPARSVACTQNLYRCAATGGAVHATLNVFGVRAAWYPLATVFTAVEPRYTRSRARMSLASSNAAYASRICVPARPVARLACTLGAGIGGSSKPPAPNALSGPGVPRSRAAFCRYAVI